MTAKICYPKSFLSLGSCNFFSCNVQHIFSISVDCRALLLKLYSHFSEVHLVCVTVSINIILLITSVLAFQLPPILPNLPWARQYNPPISAGKIATLKLLLFMYPLCYVILSQNKKFKFKPFI